MAYEIYKKKIIREEYFDGWDREQYDSMTEELREKIYQKYLLKAKVLKRDKYECQNINCKYPTSPLTVHHVKHKRNGGEDKERNLVTACRTCHKRFNNCKDVFKFKTGMNLPTHIRGHTFKLHRKESKFDWKKMKCQMKAIRKTAKHSGFEVRLTTKDWGILVMLMKWLEIPYTESEDDL